MSKKKILVSIRELNNNQQTGQPVTYEMNKKTWKALEAYRDRGAVNNGIYSNLQSTLELHKNDEDFRGISNPEELNLTQREILVSRYVQEYGQIPEVKVRLKKGRDNKLRVYERRIL